VISGAVGSETLLISGSGTFDTKNAGTSKIVTAEVVALNKANGANGGDWNNYNLTTTGSMTATADVARRAATISATPTQLTFTGTTLNQAAPTTSNLVAGDDLTINGTASGVATGVYTSALAVSGGDASNYDFTYINADLTIAPVPVDPFGPVVPPTIPDAGGSSGGGSVVPFSDNNPFELASANDLFEDDVCSVDNVAACFCEDAQDEQGKPLAGLNVCSPDKLRMQIQ
jgi:hypothetical protein